MPGGAPGCPHGGLACCHGAGPPADSTPLLRALPTEGLLPDWKPRLVMRRQRHACPLTLIVMGFGMQLADKRLWGADLKMAAWEASVAPKGRAEVQRPVGAQSWACQAAQAACAAGRQTSEGAAACQQAQAEAHQSRSSAASAAAAEPGQPAHAQSALVPAFADSNVCSPQGADRI